MRALGRDGWLLCRWPLEESIHAAIVLPPDTYTAVPTRTALVRQKRAARPVPPLGQSVFVKGQLKVLGKQTPGLPGNTTVGRCVSCVFSVPLLTEF